MDNLIETLVKEIKADTRYLAFNEREKRLQEVEDLLQEYQEANNAYQEVAKYQKHIDISKEKEIVRILKQKISTNQIIQEYYQSYHQVNDLLDTITKIIFDGISEEIDTSRYTI